MRARGLPPAGVQACVRVPSLRVADGGGGGRRRPDVLPPPGLPRLLLIVQPARRHVHRGLCCPQATPRELWLSEVGRVGCDKAVTSGAATPAHWDSPASCKCLLRSPNAPEITKGAFTAGGTWRGLSRVSPRLWHIRRHELNNGRSRLGLGSTGQRGGMVCLHVRSPVSSSARHGHPAGLHGCPALLRAGGTPPSSAQAKGRAARAALPGATQAQQALWGRAGIQPSRAATGPAQAKALGRRRRCCRRTCLSPPQLTLPHTPAPLHRRAISPWNSRPCQQTLAPKSPSRASLACS